MIVGVTGGKGGTGKSTVAVNLALALKEHGSVSLLDCDVGCPDDHLLLNATLEGKEEVEIFLPVFDESRCKMCGKCAEVCEENAIFLTERPEVIERLCSGCGACLLACPHGAISEGSREIGSTYSTKTRGIKLFSGDLKPGSPFSAHLVKAVLERGMEKSDFTVVDTAAGIHCDVVLSLRNCERILVVTEPTPFGVSDLRQVMGVLEGMGKTGEIILNRSDIAEADFGEEGEGIVERIPLDRELLDSYVNGEPLVESSPDHPISKIFKKLAEGMA